jgi:predicted nucleic acid-binding protein
MSDEKHFLDTNVLVYANDKTDPLKQAAAIRLVADGIRRGTAFISAQVLSEFWVTVTQKIEVPLERSIAAKEIERFRALRVVGIEYDTVRAAVGFQEKHRLSYWDALILAAAAIAGCSCIYTEDMNDGQTYGKVKIVNPFTGS